VGASIIHINKSIFDNYRSSNFSSNYRCTKNIDLSITNWQNRIFNGSIIIDLGKKDRAKAFINLNYKIIDFFVKTDIQYHSQILGKKDQAKAFIDLNYRIMDFFRENQTYSITHR